MLCACLFSSVYSFYSDDNLFNKTLLVKIVLLVAGCIVFSSLQAEKDQKDRRAAAAAVLSSSCCCVIWAGGTYDRRLILISSNKSRQYYCVSGEQLAITTATAVAGLGVDCHHR